VKSSQAKGISGGSGGSLYKLRDGSVLCYFFQENKCNMQTADHCIRQSGARKYLCAAKKADGNFCAGIHSKMDHK